MRTLDLGVVNPNQPAKETARSLFGDSGSKKASLPINGLGAEGSKHCWRVQRVGQDPSSSFSRGQGKLCRIVVLLEVLSLGCSVGLTAMGVSWR